MRHPHGFVLQVSIIFALLNIIFVCEVFSQVRPVSRVGTQVSQNPPTPPPVQSTDDEGAEDDESETEASATCLLCVPNVLDVLGSAARGSLDAVNSATIQSAYASYSHSEKVTKLISEARGNLAGNPNSYIQRVRGSRKKKTFCYRAVKDALRDSGMVPSVFGGSAVAHLAVRDLKAMGFKNLLEDITVNHMLLNNPKLAPKGAILVYATVPGARVSTAGHIEIKTEESGTDGYISISETRRPTYGFNIPRQRILTGILIKP